MERITPFDSHSIQQDILSAMLEISSAVCWVHDMKSNKGRWVSSPPTTEKYNLPQEDIFTEAWTNMIHPDDLEKALSVFRYAVEDTSTITFENEYRVNGKTRYYFIRDNVSIQRDAAGKAIRCIGVWSDLTDVHDKTTALQKALAAQEQLNRELIAHQQKLKATEEKLEALNEQLVKNMDLLSESEVMLKTSQQIAKTGSWKFNLKTGKCSCSEEFFVIYGLDRDFTLTDPEFFLKVLYGTQIGSEILVSVEKLRTRGVPFDIVSPLTTPLGIQKFIRLVAYPLYTDDTITEIQGVVHDITAFKEAEERLRASEEKFFTVFKFTPDFMSLARESDGVIVEVNNKAQAVSGYSESEMVGKTARELDLWVNPGELTDFFSEYSLHHKATCETVWRKKDKRQLIHIMLSSIRVQIGSEYFRLSLAKDITARKETEERLRSSEEKFSKLFRFNPDLMCLARESDRVIVDVNDKAEAITGYNQDEIIGKTAKELDLWLNVNHFNDLFDLYNRFGQASQETKWQKKNGQKIDVMVSTVRIEIGGEYYGLTIVKNITASKEAEEKFSKAFNLSPDLMSIIRERDQVIVEVNENGKTMLGYTREETLGKTTIDLDLWVLPEERDRYYQLYRSNPFISYEARWRKKSGEEIYVVINATRVELYHESYILSSVRDVTARRQAEEKFQTVFRLNPDMIAIIRMKDHIIVDINDKVYDSIGYTRAELIGQRADFLDIWLTNEDRHEINLNSENPVTLHEARLKNRKGEAIFVLVSGALIEISGEPHLLYITKDITERKRVEEEARKSLEQLAEAEKKIAEARVTALRSAMNPHFIFNALNSIQFFISKNERQEAIQYLSTFSKLIRGLLTSSAQNTIKLADELELLKHYINLELIRFEKKFNVVFNIDPKLDIGNIEIPALVVQPFVENAILHGLYAKSSEGHLKISIHKAHAEFILFEIEDDGIGRTAAGEIQARKNLEHHKSLGVSLAEERLKIINSDPHLAVETEDLFEGDKSTGTRVKIWLSIQ